MKRSQINTIIEDSIKFIEDCKFHIPPFAEWTVEEWKTKGSEYDDIRNNGLGWDVSDYGFGNFHKLGIVALTIRSAHQKIFSKYEKPFAEKLLCLEQGQELPLHLHPQKVEDLINRGGSDFFIKLYKANPDNSISDDFVDVLMDGRKLTIKAGEILRVRVGESITLLPNHYHTFWVESGKTLFGEVTMTNNEHYFYEKSPTSTVIEEDCLPVYHLFNEYPQWVSS